MGGSGFGGKTALRWTLTVSLFMFFDFLACRYEAPWEYFFLRQNARTQCAPPRRREEDEL